MGAYTMLKFITFLRYYIYQAYSFIVNLFYQAYGIVNLFTYLRAFRTYFQTD